MASGASERLGAGDLVWGCMLGNYAHSLTVAEVECKDGKMFYMHFFSLYTRTFCPLVLLGEFCRSRLNGISLLNTYYVLVLDFIEKETNPPGVQRFAQGLCVMEESLTRTGPSLRVCVSSTAPATCQLPQQQLKTSAPSTHCSRKLFLQ